MMLWAAEKENKEQEDASGEGENKTKGGSSVGNKKISSTSQLLSLAKKM